MTEAYDAWGNILSITDQNGNEITSSDHMGHLNSLRYRGYYYDEDIDMYYLQSRYYDPEIRRFINADDVSILDEDQGSIVKHNLFVYCLNNPVNMLDISGTIAVTTCVLIGAGIGIVIGGSVGALVGWGASALIAKYGVVRAANSITKGGGARFSSFSSLKRSLGSAGKGNDWYHIVEQCQIKKSKFSKYWINNSNNVININKSVHKKISVYYSKKHSFTNGKTFRNWLAGKSFEEQYKWGIKVLKMYGVKIK